jgi:hypothetical protein
MDAWRRSPWESRVETLARSYVRETSEAVFERFIVPLGPAGMSQLLAVVPLPPPALAHVLLRPIAFAIRYLRASLLREYPLQLASLLRVVLGILSASRLRVA